MRKAISGIVMPLLAILVSCGMLVGAVSVMRLSNVVEYVNVIEEGPEIPVELCIDLQVLATDATPGGDLPNYTDGNLVLGTTYDMLITYTTSKALEGAQIVVEFSMEGILPEDVTMAWRDGNLVWTEIVWTLDTDAVDDTDRMRGVLGFVGSQPEGETVNYYAQLTYNTPGTYGFAVWVEAEA